MKRPPVRPVSLGQLAGGPAAGSGIAIDALRDVEMRVSVEVGGVTLPIRDILALGPGSVIELDRLVGEPVDVLVNNHPFARGEVVVIADTFGVRITEIRAPQTAPADDVKGNGESDAGAEAPAEESGA
jgi:flagellar motor switch protein FliN/FliY